MNNKRKARLLVDLGGDDDSEAETPPPPRKVPRSKVEIEEEDEEGDLVVILNPPSIPASTKRRKTQSGGLTKLQKLRQAASKQRWKRPVKAKPRPRVSPQLPPTPSAPVQPPASIELLGCDAMPGSTQLAYDLETISTATRRRVLDRRAAGRQVPAPPSNDTVLELQSMQKHTLTDTQADQIEIFDFADLARMFPEMTVNQQPTNIGDAQEHVKEPASRLFLDAVKALPRPDFTETVDGPGDVVHALKTRRVLLPLLTSDHETLMLREAGEYPHPTKPGASLTFLPCENGDQCVCKTSYLRGGPSGGFVMMGFMYPQEYQSAICNGVNVLQSRPCILCCRRAVTRYCLLNRTYESKVTSVDTDFVGQVYRNLSSAPGGYLSDYMVTPSRRRWEGLISPIVALDLFLLRAYRDPQPPHKWRVDQSALIWQEPALPAPVPGETVADFRLRVTRQTGRDANGTHELQKLQLREQLWQLWSLPTPSRADFESLSLAEASLVSCLRSLRQVTRADFLAVDPGYWDLCCHSACLQYVHRCCFWRDIRNSGERNQVVSLLSKTVPQPCSTRCFEKAIEKYFSVSKRMAERHGQKQSTRLTAFTAPLKKKRRNTTKIHVADDVHLCRQWTVLSLLGLLPGASPEYRLYTPFMVSVLEQLHKDKYLELDKVLIQRPQLMIFGLREFMCHCIIQCPSTREAMNHLFQFEAFLVMTQRHMDWVRCLIASELRRKLRPEAEPTEVIQAFYQALLGKACLEASQKAHSNVLSVAFQRRRPPLSRSLHACLRSQKGRFHPFALDDTEPAEELPDLEGLGDLDLSDSESEDRDDDEEEEELPVPGTGPPATDVCMTRDKLVALKTWLSRLDPRKHTLLRDVWPHLRWLGIPQPALVRMAHIFERYDQARMGKRALKQNLCDFAGTFPLSMKALQTVCFLWERRHFPKVHPLPSHYARNQAQALRERFTLNPGRPVPFHRSVLYRCEVCKTLYSIVRPAWTPLTAKNLLRNARRHTTSNPLMGNKTVDMFGFRNIRKDYYNDEHYYCKNKRCCGFMKCQDQWLQTWPLLGFVTELSNGQCITLCPQKGCGMAMVINHRTNRYTKRGMACSLCTSRMDAQDLEQTLAALGIDHDTQRKFRCLKCNSFCNPSKAYVYGLHLYVCSIHHSTALLKHFQTHTRPNMTSEERTQVVLQFFDQREEQRKQAATHYNNWVLRRSRASTRARDRTDVYYAQT